LEERHLIVRQMADRTAVRFRESKRQTKENRVGWFALIVLTAGALAGVAALLGIWPFGGFQTLVTSVIYPPTPAPVAAATLFPPVPPVRKVVDVYDPAPPASSGSTAAPARTNPPVAAANYPVINFPAGPMSAIEATCEAAKQAAQNQSSAYQQNVEQECEAAKQAYERSHP
jgi:hypothetical protein